MINFKVKNTPPTQAEINEALSLMNCTVENLAEASFKIRSNKEFLQLAVKINPEALKFVTNDKDIKNDRFFIITALSSKNKDIVAKGVKWLNESEEFRNDDELVSLAVKNDGLVLKNLSKKYTEDKTIVLSAIKNNPLAIMHMDSELFNDSEIILFAFDRFNRINSEHNMILSIFSKISDKLKNDKTFIMELLGLNNLIYMGLPQKLQNDKEIIMQAVSTPVLYQYIDNQCHYIYMLDKVPQNFKDNKEIVIKAVEANSESLKFASDKLKDNKEIVIKAVEANSESLEFASDKLKDNPEVVLAASYGMNYNPTTFSNERGFRLSLFASSRIKNMVGSDCQKQDLEKLIFYENLNNNIPNKEGTKKPKLKI